MRPAQRVQAAAPREANINAMLPAASGGRQASPRCSSARPRCDPPFRQYPGRVARPSCTRRPSRATITSAVRVDSCPRAVEAGVRYPGKSPARRIRSCWPRRRCCRFSRGSTVAFGQWVRPNDCFLSALSTCHRSPGPSCRPMAASCSRGWPANAMARWRPIVRLPNRMEEILHRSGHISAASAAAVGAGAGKMVAAGPGVGD